MTVNAFPGPEAFEELGSTHSVVPVWRVISSDTVTPVAAYLRLTEKRGSDGVPGGGPVSFLLESVEHGEGWGRYSFVGRNPLATLVLRGGRVSIEGSLPGTVPRDAGILAALQALLEACTVADVDDMPEEVPPLHSGMVGYLGYDVVREIEKLVELPPDDLGVPDAVMGVIGELAAFDHWRQSVYLIAVAMIPEGSDPVGRKAAYDDALRRVDALQQDLSTAATTEGPVPVPQVPDRTEVLGWVTRRTSRELFISGVNAAKDRILAGDAFQIVLSQRFDLDLDCNPFEVYRVLRQVNPSPYMYFLRHDDVTLVGSSPEPMVKVSRGRVISRPIAGTRPRGATATEDSRLAAELAEHPKEIAEHVMLVDLARNDVGRVVRFGTEKVDELMTLERYSHVMHMTSQVSGDLVEGANAIDVLRATLPAGTVSGAPKVSAMKIIDEIELSKRGPYAGVVGYLDFSGNVDTAIAIRTMVVNGAGRASVQAGAGIVADSDPEMEDRECQFKAAALLTAAWAAKGVEAARS